MCDDFESDALGSKPTGGPWATSQCFASNFTLKVDGDKIKEKAAAEFGGNKQEFDIEGKREKKDK